MKPAKAKNIKVTWVESLDLSEITKVYDEGELRGGLRIIRR
jgi:hypothetical protein